MKSVARVTLLLVTAAVLERAVFSQLRIAGVAIDLLLLLAVAAGITGGPDRGAVVGFFAGLVLDLLSQAPLGLSALCYCLTGYVAGRLQGLVVRANPIFGSLLAGVASAAGLAFYAIAARVLGQPGTLGGHLVTVVAVAGIGNAVLYPVARRLFRWVWDDDRTLRPALR